MRLRVRVAGRMPSAMEIAGRYREIYGRYTGDIGEI